MLLIRNKAVRQAAGVLETVNWLTLKLLLKNPRAMRVFPGKVYRDYMEAMYPVEKVEFTVGEPEEVAYPVNWNNTIDQIRQLRQSERPANDDAVLPFLADGQMDQVDTAVQNGADALLGEFTVQEFRELYKRFPKTVVIPTLTHDANDPGRDLEELLKQLFIAAKSRAANHFERAWCDDFRRIS